MQFLHSSFLILGHLVAVILCRQSFDQQPTLTEVNPGSAAILICRVYEKRGRCSWQKDGKPVGTHDQKYEWAGNPALGDCSLRILNAALDLDDGEWECQVTSSTFESLDALTSRPARLLVRVPPKLPQIELETGDLVTGPRLSAREGVTTSVTCSTRYGNPAAQIRWYIDSIDVSQQATQTNMSEPDDPKKWRAHSVLKYTFRKSDHLKALRCVALHEAYDTKSKEFQTQLDIQYAPIVTVQGMPTGDIEENIDSLSLRCVVTANPEAKIVWRKLDLSQIYSFDETLTFTPATRDHSGAYMCEARNDVGSAMGRTVHIDVKYAPKISEVGPSRIVKASAFNKTSLYCLADGNPTPRFRWLQRASPQDDAAYLRGESSTLVIENATYEYQGVYVCQAMSVIKNEEKRAQSEAITVDVSGPPQILPRSSLEQTSFNRGEDALLSLLVCSDPAPVTSVWKWGSLVLEAGKKHGRFFAQTMAKDVREDCYQARLLIERLEPSDAREYRLEVENPRGTDSLLVVVKVSEPVTMRTIIGVVIACLIILLILVAVVMYTFKADRWCFRPEDFAAEPIDAKVANGSASKKNLNRAIPPDALYLPPIKTSVASDSHPVNNNNNNNGHTRRTSRPPVDSTTNYADLELPRARNWSTPTRPPTEYSNIHFEPRGGRASSLFETRVAEI